MNELESFPKIQGKYGRKRGKVKRMAVHYIYTYEHSIMKPIKHYLKEVGRGKGGVNLYKVHCTHV
jgi:hypothetical protein